MTENQTLDTIKAFINTENEFLRKCYYPHAPEEQITYAKVVKIMEEVGELSDIVLKSYHLQRRSKMSAKETSVEDELSDVLITTLLLAKHLNIDTEKALLSKISRIESRRDPLPE